MASRPPPGYSPPAGATRPVARTVPSGERGLVPAVRLTYAAPGGDYSRLMFIHVAGCPNGTESFDAEMRGLVARLGLRSFGEVETAICGALLARGCALGCGFDRNTTMGFYTRFHTPEGSSQEFSPSSHDVASQLTSSGSALSPLASDPMVPSSSWPSLAPSTGAPSPSPSPVKLVGVSAPALPSSSTNYGSGLPSSFAAALSPGHQQMYGSKFRLDNDSDRTYHPSEGITSPLVGSGFRVEDGVVAPVPVSRAHVRFAGPMRSPSLPPCVPSPVPSGDNAVTIYVARSDSLDDTAMSLGGGRDTNATGLGDSQHAVPESSLPSQGQRRSPHVSLPPTASSVSMDMMDALDDIAQGRSSVLSDRSSECDDNPVRRLVCSDKEYDNLGQVAEDVKALADGFEEMRAVLSTVLGEKVVLEKRVELQAQWINVLERQVDDLVRGKPIPTAARAKAGSAKGKAVRSTPAPVPVAVARSPPPPVPTHTRPQAVAGPAAFVAGSWVEVARRGKSRPAGPPTKTPSVRAPLSSSPSPITTRERHITLRFASRKTVVLPAGCSAETIRSRMNSFLANQGKINGSHPYVREARLRADIGCIYTTLAEHSFAQIEPWLERCHMVLVRDLALPEFAFVKDAAKIKVLVLGVPLADTGRGSIWRVEDWVGDKVYDGLRTDLERSNPGIFTDGRPNILGSIHAMKEAKMTSCQVKFTVERSGAVDSALRAGKLCLRGGNRAVRIWTDHRPAQVCNNCLTLGHISTMCAAPPRCRLCRGSHKTAQHLCPALNCPGGQGESCEHTVRICMLCESSGHFTGYDRCPALRASPEAPPPPANGSPIAGDSGAVSGVADRDRNRFNVRSRRRRRPTPPGEMAVNEADMALEKMSKGKATALPSNNVAAAPVPKSILRKSASDPNLPTSSGSSGQ